MSAPITQLLGETLKGKDGPVRTADALKGNAVLKVLYIERCGIGDQGGIALAEALKFNAVLTTLGLALNYAIGTVAMQKLRQVADARSPAAHGRASRAARPLVFL